MSWLSIIYISLFISIIINIATIWYAAKMVKELMSVSATVEEMFEDIKEEIQKYKLSFSLIEEGEESENDERFSPSPPP